MAVRVAKVSLRSQCNPIPAIQDMAEMRFLPYLATLRLDGISFFKGRFTPNKKRTRVAFSPPLHWEEHPNAFATTSTLSSPDVDYGRVVVWLLRNLVEAHSFQVLTLQKANGKSFVGSLDSPSC